MKIEVGDVEIMRGSSGGVESGSRYPVVADGTHGEVLVGYDARFRNPKEQYSENEIGHAISRLVEIEKNNSDLTPGFVLHLTTTNAASVGLVWHPVREGVERGA